MNLKPKRQTKTFVVLALMLTISLMAATQFTAVTAQTTGTVTINGGATYTNSTAVTLTISATNASQMCFSNDNATWSSWENYTTTKNWTIINTEGTETVYVQFQDSNNQTSTASASINLDITPPVPELLWEPYSNDFKTIRFSAYDYTTDTNGVKNATVNFGDGNVTSITNSVFLHTYAAIGNYNITLTMVDFAGNSASGTLTVTIPDVNTIATPTPAPTITAQPTYNPTEQPTEQPSATPTSALTLDPLTTVVLVGAIGIIIVVVLAIIMVLRRKTKTVKPQEQQSTPEPAKAPPPQQKPQPSAPSGPSDSNFTI